MNERTSVTTCTYPVCACVHGCRYHAYVDARGCEVRLSERVCTEYLRACVSLSLSPSRARAHALSLSRSLSPNLSLSISPLSLSLGVWVWVWVRVCPGVGCVCGLPVCKYFMCVRGNFVVRMQSYVRGIISGRVGKWARNGWPPGVTLLWLALPATHHHA